MQKKRKRAKKILKRRESSDKRRILVLSIIISLSALIFINTFIGLVIYPRYQYGLAGGFAGVLDLYAQYPEWFDFFIFLTIFLGLGKGVFGEHLEGKGATAVYTGLGIFLALALIVWERNSGINLVELFGPVAFLFVILIVSFYIFKWTSSASGVAVLGVGIAAAVFYYLFLNFYCYGIYSYVFTGFYSYSYAFPFDPCGNPAFIYLILAIIIIVGIAKLFKK